uniref:Beta-defensin n=1 Tax=Rhinolophus ferrumequinum TaxID=59479 RepID=A0A671FXF8_RHIFE
REREIEISLKSFFYSRKISTRGKFKEVCERPNGSCRKSCLRTEIHVGLCLNGRRCCLHMRYINNIIDHIPPKKH